MHRRIISKTPTQTHIRCAWRHGRPGGRSGALASWYEVAGVGSPGVVGWLWCLVIGIRTAMPFGLLCRGAWGSACVWRLLLNSNPNSCSSTKRLPFPQLSSWVLSFISFFSGVCLFSLSQHSTSQPDTQETAYYQLVYPPCLLNMRFICNSFAFANLFSRKCNAAWIIF